VSQRPLPDPVGRPNAESSWQSNTGSGKGSGSDRHVVKLFRAYLARQAGLQGFLFSREAVPHRKSGEGRESRSGAMGVPFLLRAVTSIRNHLSVWHGINT
jgi:hypothetical protein